MGLVMGVAPGMSTITVQVNGVTSSYTVTVSNATLVSLAITPATPPAFAKGTTQQFTATGTYSDGTTENLTRSVSWTSSNPAVYTVDQSGLAMGTGVGSAQLTAMYQGQTATTPSVQVTPATVASVTVTPANAGVVAGSMQQYAATATYTDGTTQDATNAATWSSSNMGVATINSTGYASALSPGSTVVQAQVNGVVGRANLTVTAVPVTLQQVIVMAVNGHSNPTAGGTQQNAATGVYSDGSTQDVTARSVWSSSNTGVATVNSNGLATLLAAGNTAIQAQFGGQSGSLTVTVSPATVTLQSISLYPSTPSLPMGVTEQFSATGTYTDGSTQDLTSVVTWSSSAASVATISTSGLASAGTAGQTLISATYQGVSMTVTLTVNPVTLVSIALSPTSMNLSNGTRQQLTATGTLSNGSTQDVTNSVTWTTSNSSIGTVNATGLVSSVGVGQATITAQSGNVSAMDALNVTAATATSLQLSPATVTLPQNGVQQLMTTATFSDGTSQDVTTSAVYTTANSNVATVDSNAKLRGVGRGSTTATATLGSVSATSSVTISPVTLSSISITPSNLSLAAGLNQQLTAVGTYSDGSTQDLTRSATWTTSNTSVVSVSSTGDVTASQPGSVTITATSGSVSGTDTVTATNSVVTAISVSPASTTLAAGQTQQYAATATYSDGSQRTITSAYTNLWSVSDPTKASISNQASNAGTLTSKAAGNLNVVATVGAVSGTASVTVTAATLNTISIAPNPVSLPAGTNQQMTVTGTYTDGSTADLTSSATWTTASASVASVNASGILHGMTAGSTTVHATVGSASAMDAVTVTAAVLNSIAITPSAPSVALGLHQQMTATGTYTDGSMMNISSQVQWSSSSPSVATVSGTGLVSTQATGSTMLTATLNSVSAQTPFTVSAVALQSLAVQAPQSNFALGLSLQLTVIGTYTDGTTQNLTSSVTWSSGTPGVGMVSSTGLATGVTAGTFNAQASKNGITASLPLTVTSAILQSIVVTPSNQVLVNLSGNPVQYTATGHFSDGTTQNLTNSVHWAVTGLNVGSISQSGQLTALNVGSGNVTATSGAITGLTPFTVVGI